MSKKRQRRRVIVRPKGESTFHTARQAMINILDQTGIQAHRLRNPHHDAHYWRWEVV